MKCLESVTAHDDAVNAVTVSVDGVVYTGSADMRIRVWVRPERKKRHALVATLEKHKSAVNALALSLDGRRRDDGKFLCLNVLVGHQKPVKSLSAGYEAESSDVVSLFSGSLDGKVGVWRIKLSSGSRGDSSPSCSSPDE
ncbi:hypothetical protein Ancab_021264 [Ancistrocladus abbreviatus]